MSALLAPAKPHRIKATHHRRRRIASGRFVQRYYDPELGRFLTPDPVGPEEDFIKHFNRYVYAYDNPVRYTDPDGTCPICLVPFIIGALMHSDPANAPAPGETPISTSPAEAIGDALPPAKGVAVGKAVVNAVKEHTKNARPSTKAKHEAGQARKQKDRGGEKGDSSRAPPRKAPPDHKGPWPPKPPEPPKPPKEK